VDFGSGFLAAAVLAFGSGLASGCAFGFAAGYQLARLGAGKVVMIDQYEPATQVSPKAAGLFKSVQASCPGACVNASPLRARLRPSLGCCF